MANLFVVALICAQFPYLYALNGSSQPSFFPFIAFIFIALTSQKFLYIPKVFLFFVALIICLGISTLGADPIYPSIISFCIICALMFFALMVTSIERQHTCLRTKLIKALMVTGVFVSVLGLFQYSTYLHFGPGTTMLVPYLLPPGSFRISGVYGQPNMFAHFLAISLLSFIFYYLHAKTEFTPRFKNLRFVPIYVVSLAFFLTKSRSGLLSLVVILFSLFYFCWKKIYPLDDNSRRELFKIILTVMLGGISAKILSNSLFLDAFFPNALYPLQNVFGGFDRSHSNFQRLVFWLTAVLITVDHPWYGVGLDNFKTFLAEYQVEAIKILQLGYEDLGYSRWTHNEYLQILAEGGLTSFLVLLSILSLFLYSFFRIQKSGKCNYKRFYDHLFLFPMLIHSFFEWPIRHPSLAAIFFAFIGLYLAPYAGWRISSNRGNKIFIQAFVAFILIILGAWLLSENKITQFRKEIGLYGNIRGQSEEFVRLSKNPFFEYSLLKNALPTFVKWVVRENDVETAKSILPLGERMVELEGAYWQLYNVSKLYSVLDRREDALLAITKAIDRKPDFELGWGFKRYLIRTKVAEETGVSLEELLRRAREDAEKLNGSTFRNSKYP